MTTGTDRARGVLRQAIAEQWSYRDLLDLAIKQHEALRGEHAAYLVTRTGNTPHWRAVAYRSYTELPRDCPECLVLLQWELMWEEK